MSRQRMPVRKKKQKPKTRIKSKIRVDDTVKVISGRHKGATGRVIFVDREKGRVKIEDTAMQKRHLAPQKNPRFPEGGIIEQPGSIHISNVMVMSEEAGRPVRLGVSYNQDGKKQRVARGRNVKAMEV